MPNTSGGIEAPPSQLMRPGFGRDGPLAVEYGTAPDHTVTVHVSAEMTSTALSFGSRDRTRLPAVVLAPACLPALGGCCWSTTNRSYASGYGPSSPSRLEVLSEREREVLVLIGRGLSNASAARMLFMSEATIKTYVAHVDQARAGQPHPGRDPGHAAGLMD